MLTRPLSVRSYLYQIAHLGDDDDEPEFSSAMPLEEGDTFLFQPRPLKNLVVVDELDSLSPIMHAQVGLALLVFNKDKNYKVSCNHVCLCHFILPLLSKNYHVPSPYTDFVSPFIK